MFQMRQGRRGVLRDLPDIIKSAANVHFADAERCLGRAFATINMTTTCFWSANVRQAGQQWQLVRPDWLTLTDTGRLTECMLLGCHDGHARLHLSQ